MITRDIGAKIAAVGVLVLPIITQAETINVDLDHGTTYSGTAIAPDAGTVWNGISLSGQPVSTSIQDVSDSLGNTLSGIDVSLASANGTSQINRYNNTSDFSPNPVDLMADYSYGTTFNVTVSGLASGASYTLYAYLCGNNTGQGGGLSIAAANGGNGLGNFDYVSATGASFRDISSGGGEGVSYLVRNATVDGSGEINLRVDTYMNGFQLTSAEEAPSISGLTDAMVSVGDDFTLNPSVTGTEPITYQWRSNSIALAGETNSTLALNNVQTNQSGTVYSLIASNAYGADTNGMALTVTEPIAPSITLQPANQTLTIGLTATFTAAATGNPTPNLQWQKGGVDIVGQTNSTLTVTHVQVDDSGIYTLVASNNMGTTASSNAVLTVEGPDGFCMVNGTTTGGSGGPIVTVDNASDFKTQINMAGPRIIQVQGAISINLGADDGRSFCSANKTIIGLGTDAMLYGNLWISGVTNVIVRNLRVHSRGNDGLTIWNSNHVWVDHCTFFDCVDGMCDMSKGAHNVTVSWCKFHYVNQPNHRFTMIADGYDNGGSITYGWYTLHHNWWSTNCDQRMASSSYGRLHYYNNYWNCPGNYYASLARVDTQILSENNYYLNVRNPLYSNDLGDPSILIQSSGNLYPGCFDNISPGTDTVFTPSYSYSLDSAADVPAIVMAGAGAPGSDTQPVPPKIWDGGASNNNLSTTDNWALNDMPGWSDSLIFAGSTRLSPNNNLYYDSGSPKIVEFNSVTFSNTAGAFVLGGNPLRLGSGIYDDSAATQTINLDLDFTYAQERLWTTREFNVASGPLVINGDIAGSPDQGYFTQYSVYKQGDGLLTLNGINTFIAAWQLDGGLVQFKTLNTASSGSLGEGSTMNFNGGGLRWASSNTADISARTVTFQSGGATLDSGANSIAFASPIGNGGSGGLTKTGSGSITLNGNNTYHGSTFIAAGTLALGASGSIPNSPQIMLTNSAVLDVTGRSDGSLALGSGKSLAGSGSVLGNVTVGSGATVSPGFSLGTLGVGEVLVFQSGSTCVMELDTSLAVTNDLLTGMSSVTYGGSLVIENIGPALADGDTFKLFDAASYSNAFDSITLPPLDGDLVWTNRLTVDGTLAVVSSEPPVDTTPTNIVFSMIGSNMTFSWPADHIGWRLEAQTNSLGTNWFTVPGSSETNMIDLPFFPDANSAFFRLRYP